MSFKKTLCGLVDGLKNNFKKAVCVATTASVLSTPTVVYSQNKNYQQPKQSVTQSYDFNKKEEGSVIPLVWLGGNILLAGASGYLAYDALKAKDNYEKNLSLYNNTTMEKYEWLLNEKKNAEGKLNLALVTGIGTGISILANIVFWNSFNEKKDKKFSLQYDPSRNAYVLAVNKEF